MTATTQGDPAIHFPAGLSTAEPRKATPAVWWAVAGAVVAGLWVYLVFAWVHAGHFERTPLGSTPLPSWMDISVRVWEGISTVAAIGAVYAWLIRPWRREGKISLDGLMVLAFFSVWWQDALANWTQVTFTYNSNFVNMGSWFGELPGWLSPHAHLLPEPLLVTGQVYIYACLGATIAGNALMRKAQQRWPQLGKLGLVAGAFLGFALFDLVAETIWIRTGMFIYPSTVEHLPTLFRGHYYQFPLYEPVLFGATWTAWACIRYFRDDKGRTVAERGVDRLRISDRKKTLIRALAVVGAINLAYLATYNIPMQLIGMNVGAWPKDVQSRSYLTDGICGPGTTYACPGPAVPLSRPTSAHLDPAGNLVPAHVK